MASSEHSFNPSFITATTTLLQSVDRKIMAILRDGKSYIGILRSVDNFGTCVLENAVERIYVGNKFGDIQCGIIILRGENLAIVGDINEEDENKSPLVEVSLEEIIHLQKQETIQLIQQRENWKRLGIFVDKSIFNWFIPYCFFEEE